jgi:hypothetical protein
VTIEIHKPELEAMIVERMKVGGFHDVEDVLLYALQHSGTTGEPTLKQRENRTGADLIAALQSSPHREIDIEPSRHRLPIRDVTS